METLRSKLKNSTADLHLLLDATQFHQSLRRHQVPKVSVISYMHCLSVIQASLESALEKTNDPRVKVVWSNQQPKLKLLQADLELLRAAESPPLHDVLKEALRLSSEILRSSEDAVSLLGYLYVFEGSQIGGVLLRSLFEKTMDLAAGQLTYFGCYGQNTHLVWAEFTKNLDSISVSQEEEKRILECASAVFQALERILIGLDPVVGRQGSLDIKALNPEAGDHSLPQDPLEIEIALRAGVRAWEKFPYLGARFKERGQRFTTSDSCWLMTLIPMEYQPIYKSIAWLRTVLASRGIPTLILETHLHQILLEYESTFPAKRPTTKNLRRVAEELRKNCERFFEPSLVSQLRLKYESRLDGLSRNKMGDVVGLLISAKADELDGIQNSFRSVESWFLDSERFERPWVDLVLELSAEIQSLPHRPELMT